MTTTNETERKLAAAQYLETVAAKMPKTLADTARNLRQRAKQLRKEAAAA